MSNDGRRDSRQPISLDIRFKSATLVDFVNRHSRDVSRGGIFVKTKSPLSSGTLIKFDVSIGEKESLIQGVGRVVWRREEDAGDGNPAGMGIKFIKLDPTSKENLETILASRPEEVSGKDEQPDVEESEAPPESPPERIAPVRPEGVPKDAKRTMIGMGMISPPLKKDEAAEESEEEEQDKAPEQESPSEETSEADTPDTEETSEKPEEDAPEEESEEEAGDGEEAAESEEKEAEEPAAALPSVPPKENEILADITSAIDDALEETPEETEEEATKEEAESDTDEAAETEKEADVDKGKVPDDEVTSKIEVEKKPEKKPAPAPKKAPEKKEEKAASKKRYARPEPKAPVQSSGKGASKAFWVIVTIIVLAAVLYFVFSRSSGDGDADSQAAVESGEIEQRTAEPTPPPMPPTPEETPREAAPAPEPVVVEEPPEEPEPVVEEKPPVMGTLEVETDPPGAKITVAGLKFAAPSPVKMDNLNVGDELEVTATLFGYVTQTKKIVIAEEPVSLSFKMKPAMLTLSFAGEPRGAIVNVDGKRWGRTPIKVNKRGLKPTLSYEYMRPGYVSKTGTIQEIDWEDQGRVWSVNVTMDLVKEVVPEPVKPPTPTVTKKRKPKPKPEPAAAPEPKPEPKPEPAPEPKPEPEPEPEPKPEPAPAPEPEPKPEPPPAPKPAEENKPPPSQDLEENPF